MGRTDLLVRMKKGEVEPRRPCTAPAIANAIYDAVGVWITELPITPEKVLAALRQKKTKEEPEQAKGSRKERGGKNDGHRPRFVGCGLGREN